MTLIKELSLFSDTFLCHLCSDKRLTVGFESILGLFCSQFKKEGGVSVYKCMCLRKRREKGLERDSRK